MSGTRFKADNFCPCPQYVKETALEIRCRGIVGDYTTSLFRSALEKTMYKDDFCDGVYMSCPIYQSIEENEN